MPIPTVKHLASQAHQVTDPIGGLTDYAVEYNANGTLLYEAMGAPGASSDTAAWRIVKWTHDGSISIMRHADGDPQTLHAWDDRASLTYP
jgi:hypothetical protein